MDPLESGHLGREASQKQGKTFFKGRSKQVARERNPSQWSGYNKAPRIKHSVSHPDPLGSQLISTRHSGVLSTKAFTQNKQSETKNDMDQEYLDETMTAKLLQMSKQQMDDIKEEESQLHKLESSIPDIDQSAIQRTQKLSEIAEKHSQIRAANLTLEDLLGADDDAASEASSVAPLILEDTKLTDADEAAMEMFLPPSSRQQATLTDVIMNRYKQTEEETMSTLAPEKIIHKKLPKDVIRVYTQVGNVLKRWKSGKLPKAFKMIPILSDWEEVLYLTKPDEWTPHVVFQATKMFASQSKATICQRFYNTVLLPRVRDDIEDHKKLNFHLYQAVRKATFKSQAFFRGFFLPLCADECRAREAVIISGVIARTSIPVIQSALAIYKLLELPYSGPVHYFLRVLLNKRYALPLKVLAALVKHFLSFENDARTMPVIWHQTLLTFAERYKKSLDNDQKKALKKLLKKQWHKDITKEVKKELFSEAAPITAMDVDI